MNTHIEIRQITNNKSQATNMKGEFYAVSSQSAVALRSAIVDVNQLSESLSEQERLITHNSLLKTISQPKADEPLAQKRSNTMKHPEVVAGGSNAQQEINNNYSNTKITKRSKVMNATTLFSRALVVIVSIFFMAAVAVGQNLILSGAATIGGTVKVKGDINNASATGVNTFTGTVQLKGSSAQSIGYSTATQGLVFATITAPGTLGKTFMVSTSVTTTIDVAGGSAQFILNGSTALTISGTITNTGGASTPYVFSNASSEVIYSGSGQTIWGGATPVTYYKLTVNSSGTNTLGGNVTAASALSVAAGTMAIGNNTLYVNGTYSTTGAVSGGPNSDLVLNGSGDISPFAVTSGLKNLTLNRVGNTITLGSGLLVAGAATITTGTISLPTNQTLTLSGTGTVVTGSSDGLSLASGSTVDYSTADNTVFAANYSNLTFGSGSHKTLPSGTLGVAGFLSSSATTVIHNNGTVDFNGASAQTIPASITWYNLTTTGGSTKTAVGSVSIAASFVNAASTTLNMVTQTLSLGSSTTNSGTVQFGGAANGLLIASGTVEYNGSVQQTVKGDNALTYTNLIFSSTGSKLITNAAGKVHTLGSLAANVNLQIGANSGDTGAELDVDGDLNIGATTNVTNYGTINVGN